MGDLLEDYDATGLADLVARGDITAVELVEASIARIEALNPKLNAVIHRQFERALREAGSPLPDGPFRGVPILFKDFGCEEAGEPHHQGMRLLRDAQWVATRDSDLALRFRSLGFIPVGRTNTPELAVMGTTEPDSYGPTHNPWNLDRSPGGSSGGSGAAVAAGLVPVAHANDIAGSIRIPASQCGAVGLKPSTRRVNVTPGPGGAMVSEGAITRTVRDAAAVLDGLTLDRGSPALTDEVGRDPGRLRVGLCLTAFTGADVDDGCVAAARDAAEVLEGLGHSIEEAWPPALYEPDLLALATQLAAAQTAVGVDVCAQQLGRPIGEDDVEPTTWRLISIGRALSAEDIAHAQERERELGREIRPWWDDFDLLLTPTSAEPGPPLGVYKQGTFTPGRGSAFTRVFNATGQPAVSLPLGWPNDGMPRGVQLVAGLGREDLLIRIGSQLEQAAPWFDRRPPLA
jgi:amidase